jgi:hypothetical protein
MTVRDINGLKMLMKENPEVFGRDPVKKKFKLDFFTIDLDGTAKVLVNVTRYWFGLFSHRRGDYLWKGMIEVPLEDLSDGAALAAVGD